MDGEAAGACAGPAGITPGAPGIPICGGIFGADIGPGIPGLTPGGPDIPTCGTGG